MKSYFPHKILIAQFLLLIGLNLSGQSHFELQQLRVFSENAKSKFLAEQSVALRWADSLHLPVKLFTQNGQYSELMAFRNGFPVYYITHNLDGANATKSSNVWPGGSAGLSLTGSGRTLALWDGGKVRNTHQEFLVGSRVTQMDGATSLSDHATHVAGSMIASGTVANAKGMSYQALLNAYDWNNDASEMATAAANGLNVSNHSYGLITGWAYGNWSSTTGWHWFGNPTISTTTDYNWGFYSTTARDWDVIARNASNYLIVKSAGNDRLEGPTPGTSHYVYTGNNWIQSTDVRDLDGGPNGYDCISHSGTSKNILTVGAVTSAGLMSSFSGWGPTDDGRIKPDIVAKGVSVYSSVATSNTAYSTYNGTSMSSPIVSGSIGLLLQHQNNLYPSVPMRSASMKGLIINTATDLGNAGPDYQFGWGMMNTEAAAALMTSNNNFGNNFNIRELSLSTGETKTITVFSNGSPLRATICWTDQPGTTPALSLNPANLLLVNDLDLRIVDANSTVFSPFVLSPSNPSATATTGDNFRDNVEQILINAPSAGTAYTITINHKGASLSGGSQNFSLIISGIYPTAVWTGAVSTDPTNNNNWNHFIPTSTTNLIVPAGMPNQPLINGNLVCNNLTIKNGSSVTIAPQGRLTVNGTITNETGNNGLIIESDAAGTGSLLHFNAIDATIKRYIAGSILATPTRYHSVSIPLKQSANPVTGLFNGSYLLRYEANAGVWASYGAATNTPLTVNQGYLIWYNGNFTTYSFAGSIQNGSFAASIPSTTSDKFNLVPNPYPSAINWDASSGWTKSNLYNSIWVWNRNSNNYASYINGIGTNGGSNIIAPGQSFFVRSTAASAALTLSDAVRLHSSQAFLKHNPALNGLRLSISTETGSDEAIVRFDENATNQFDPDWDSDKLFGGIDAPQLYSFDDFNRELSINTLRDASTSRTVNIGFKLDTDKSVRLHINSLNANEQFTTIVLEDKLINNYIHLQDQNYYDFMHHSGNDPARFRLHFTGITNLNEPPNIDHVVHIWIKDKRLYISTSNLLNEKANLKICDLMGRELIAENFILNGLNSFPIDALGGIIVAHVASGKKMISKKIFIH